MKLETLLHYLTLWSNGKGVAMEWLWLLAAIGFAVLWIIVLPRVKGGT
jgi:hypothetical protein